MRELTLVRKLLLVALTAVMVTATLLVVSKLGTASASTHYTFSDGLDQRPRLTAEAAVRARSEIVRILAITLGGVVVLAVAWALTGRRSDDAQPALTVQVASDTPVANTATTAGTASGSAARLRDLESLRAEGLITADEYQARRKAILDTL